MLSETKVTQEEATKGLDLDTVNEHLLEKEDGELSFNELEKYKKGTTFSRAQVQKLHRRYAGIKGEKQHADKEDIIRVMPHTLKNSFILDRMVDVACRGTGKIDFAAFLTIFSPFELSCPQDTQREYLFSLYDIDGDGKVSPGDLHHVFSRLFDGAPDSQIHQIVNNTFQSLDVDLDGYLLVTDFKAANENVLSIMHCPFSSQGEKMRTVGSPDLTVRGMSPDRNPSLTDGTAVRTTRARLLAMYTQTIKESPWLTSPSPERLRNTSVRLGNDAEGQGRWRDWNSMRKDGVTISTTEYRELLEAHRDLVFLRKGKGRSVHRVRGRSVHTDGASVHADTEPLSPAAHHSSIILQTESNALTTTVPVNEWFSGSVRVEEDVLLITTATDPHKRLSFFLNATKLSPLTTNDGIGIKGGGKVCYLRFEACDVAAAFLEDIEAYIHHSIQRARGQREVYEESVRSHRSPSYERYQHMAPLDRHERSVMEPRQSVTPILPCHPHNSFDRYEKYHPVDEEKVIASLRSASPDKKVRIQEHTSRRRRRRRSRSTSEPRTRRGSSKAASSSSHHRRRRRHSTTPSAQPYQPEYLARSP